MLKDILKLSNGKSLDCHKIVVGESYIQVRNSNGSEVYYEDSKGVWCKREYDEKGNRVYLENSYGYWFKAEYDENGNKVYYENSEGTIRDNRPKTVELTIEEIQSKLGFKVKVIEGK